MTCYFRSYLSCFPIDGYREHLVEMDAGAEISHSNDDPEQQQDLSTTSEGGSFSFQRLSAQAEKRGAKSFSNPNYEDTESGNQNSEKVAE